jgi:alkyl sulfatase BDS1-like metallo-beta-lactamase superfamily hydrolase
MYLSGAQELRSDARPGGPQSAALDVVRNTPTPMLLDLLAVRLDPAKAKDGEVSVDLVFPDRKERIRVAVKHAVLTYEADPNAGKADAVYTLPRAQFLNGALAGADLSGAATSGDRTALARLLAMLSPPTPGFPIVTR